MRPLAINITCAYICMRPLGLQNRADNAPRRSIMTGYDFTMARSQKCVAQQVFITLLVNLHFSRWYFREDIIVKIRVEIWRFTRIVITSLNGVFCSVIYALIAWKVLFARLKCPYWRLFVNVAKWPAVKSCKIIARTAVRDADVSRHHWG